MKAVWPCPHSLMDRTQASGACDRGSIPRGGTSESGIFVGLPRIELGLQDPQPCVLPLYDSPFFMKSSFGPPGIEPGLYEPESYVLPVYYGPREDFMAPLRRVHLSGFEPETFRM